MVSQALLDIFRQSPLAGSYLQSLQAPASLGPSGFNGLKQISPGVQQSKTAYSDADPLTIGHIEFQGLEAPEELVLGMERMVVRKDFPGGGRSLQDFGAFPPDMVTVKGILLGPDAESRSLTLEQQAMDFREVPLTWRQHKYFGVIKHYKPTIHHAHYIEFDIEFWPTRNEKRPHPASLTTDKSDMVNWAFQQANDLFVKNPPPAMDFNTYTEGNDPFVTQKTAFNELQKAMNIFQQSYSGRVAQAPIEFRFSVGNFAGRIARSMIPLRGSSDLGISIAAAAGMSFLGVLETSIKDLLPGVQNVPVTNPNLPQLASLHYGNPTLWPIISEANKDILQPNEINPIGDFMLKIPINPTYPQGALEQLPT